MLLKTWRAREEGRERGRERERTPASCRSRRIFEDEVGHGSIRQKGRKTENAPPFAAPRLTGFKRLLNEVQNDRHVGPMLWPRGGISGIKNRWWKARRGVVRAGRVWISAARRGRSAGDLAAREIRWAREIRHWRAGEAGSPALRSACAQRHMGSTASGTDTKTRTWFFIETDRTALLWPCVLFCQALSQFI